jgi:8-oxo-dGTP pyrophosphatase MutT (NUDIX family)
LANPPCPIQCFFRDFQNTCDRLTETGMKRTSTSFSLGFFPAHLVLIDCRRASVALILRFVPNGPKSASMEQPCRTVEELLERPWVQGNLEYLFGKETISMTFIDATLDVLFIRRAVNPQDRWSGQLAFPGGRRENNEDDAQCCIRFGSLLSRCKRNNGRDWA